MPKAANATAYHARKWAQQFVEVLAWNADAKALDVTFRFGTNPICKACNLPDCNARNDCPQSKARNSFLPTATNGTHVGTGNETFVRARGARLDGGQALGGRSSRKAIIGKQTGSLN